MNLSFDTRHRVKYSSIEQDRAAGGREARLIKTEDGKISRASVELKYLGQSGSWWAYLRWSSGGKTVNRYLGKTEGKSRSECLNEAWNLAREKGLSGVSLLATVR